MTKVETRILCCAHCGGPAILEVRRCRTQAQYLQDWRERHGLMEPEHTVQRVIQQTVAKHRLMSHFTKRKHKEAPHD